MKKVLLPLLLAAPLCAQSLEFGIHGYSQMYPAVGSPSTETKSATAFAGRFGYSIIDLGPTLLQVSAVYQPKVESEVKVGGIASSLKLGDEYFGAGVMFTFKALVAFGAGLDYRAEKLTWGTASTTYGRSWARVNLGFAFPIPIVKPFIMVEVAAPLTKQSYSSSLGPEDRLKALAPNLQAGIYAGIRF